jgi:hypothetical protein
MDPDIPVLLSVADDYDAAGAQYATLSALLRRVAGKIHAPHPMPNRVSPFAGTRVVDGDDIPGVPCAACEE